MDLLKMYSLLNTGIFHCHVSLLEGTNSILPFKNPENLKRELLKSTTITAPAGWINTGQESRDHGGNPPKGQFMVPLGGSCVNAKLRKQRWLQVDLRPFFAASCRYAAYSFTHSIQPAQYSTLTGEPCPSWPTCHWRCKWSSGTGSAAAHKGRLMDIPPTTPSLPPSCAFCVGNKCHQIDGKMDGRAGCQGKRTNTLGCTPTPYLVAQLLVVSRENGSSVAHLLVAKHPPAYIYKPPRLHGNSHRLFRGWKQSQNMPQMVAKQNDLTMVESVKKSSTKLQEGYNYQRTPGYIAWKKVRVKTSNWLTNNRFCGPNFIRKL